jgi:hypothetical protein
MSLQMLKKYWYAFPLLGIIVWAVIYFYVKSQVSKKMESVREAKAAKSAEFTEEETLLTVNEAQ